MTLLSFLVSGRQDSNLRPPVPKTGALPGCATPRLCFAKGLSERKKSRGDRIRTCDHLFPKQERYRAALHPAYSSLRYLLSIALSIISELRVQRYDFFLTPPNILSEFCIYLTVIKQNSNKTYIKEAKTSKKQARLLFFRTIGPYGKRITFSKVSLPSRNISEYASYCNDYRHSMNGLRARYY